MFDLNNSVLNWKNSLKSRDSFTTENIDELESHLNEQISDLNLAGLNDEEAFWVAQKRIGTIQSLDSEFTKINNLNVLKKKIYWMLTGIAGVLLYVFTVTSAYYVFVSLCMVLNFDPVSFILINSSFNQIVILSVSTLILWIMTSRNSRVLDKYFYNKLESLKKSRFKIFAISTFAISSVLYFYYTYNLQTDINRWIANSESYSEFKQINKILNPSLFVFDSAVIIFVYYFSFRKKKRLDIISN